MSVSSSLKFQQHWNADKEIFKHFSERVEFLFSNSVGPIPQMSVNEIQPICICERDNWNQALLRAKNHTPIA